MTVNLKSNLFLTAVHEGGEVKNGEIFRISALLCLPIILLP
jgi:hypothetical protein